MAWDFFDEKYREANELKTQHRKEKDELQRQIRKLQEELSSLKASTSTPCRTMNRCTTAATGTSSAMSRLPTAATGTSSAMNRCTTAATITTRTINILLFELFVYYLLFRCFYLLSQ
jgi:chromosome segregation ATPase